MSIRMMKCVWWKKDAGLYFLMDQVCLVEEGCCTLFFDGSVCN
jgi:hypothetical protein